MTGMTPPEVLRSSLQLEEEDRPVDEPDVQTEVLSPIENGWVDETGALAPLIIEFLSSNTGQFGVDLDVSGLDQQYFEDRNNGNVKQVLVYREDNEIQRIKVTFVNSGTEVFLIDSALSAFLETLTVEIGE